MGIAAAGLLSVSCVLPWMSLVTVAVVGGLAFPVFGAQASLWNLAAPSAPVALVAFVPLATALLLLVATLAALSHSRWAILLASIGLLLFFAGTDGLFGVHRVGVAFTVVAPGPGVEWAGAGLAASAASFRFRRRPVVELLRGIRSPDVLGRVGLFLAVAFLAIDAVDHASGGDVLAVFGSLGPESILHALLVVSLAALVGIYRLGSSRFLGRTASALVLSAGVGLLLDGVFHALTGQVAEFVGHTGAEAMAHVAMYYGIALLTISRFLIREP